MSECNRFCGEYECNETQKKDSMLCKRVTDKLHIEQPSEEFKFWYERHFLQSPSLCALKYDDEKMWEAWKASQNTEANEALKKCLRVLKPIAEQRMYEAQWVDSAIKACKEALDDQTIDNIIKRLEKLEQFKLDTIQDINELNELIESQDIKKWADYPITK